MPSRRLLRAKIPSTSGPLLLLPFWNILLHITPVQHGETPACSQRPTPTQARTFPRGVASRRPAPGCPVNVNARNTGLNVTRTLLREAERFRKHAPRGRRGGSEPALGDTAPASGAAGRRATKRVGTFVLVRSLRPHRLRGPCTSYAPLPEGGQQRCLSPQRGAGDQGALPYRRPPLPPAGAAPQTPGTASRVPLSLCDSAKLQHRGGRVIHETLNMS